MTTIEASARAFNDALADIGWTPHRLASILSVPQTRTRRWADGLYPCPDNILAWLQRLAKAHREAGLPTVIHGG